jgi:hypothetical protein
MCDETKANLLMNRLQTQCLKNADYSRALVKQKLNIGDNELEDEADVLTVSLLCPLMSEHVQYFELNSYLFMNEKKPTWECPVCDKYTPYEQLIVDGLFEEILAKAGDVEEVQFSPDGQWTVVDKNTAKENAYLSSDEAATDASKKVLCIDLALDSDDEPDVRRITPWIRRERRLRRLLASAGIRGSSARLLRIAT